MPIHVEELRQLAESAARLGGSIAREAFGQSQIVRLKPDASEVTELDLAAERAIVAHIHELRRQDEFIGEEGVRASPAAAMTSARRPDPHAITWVIDPIDGTRNYIRGVPMFACSVAAMRHGAPLVGAVYDPMNETLYSAALGHGALRDGEPLHLPEPEADRRAQPLVVVPSKWRSEAAPFMRTLLERTIVRSLGCATLHLMLVATGGVDGAYLNNCKLWDIAAALLIVTEAGGVATAPDGSELFPIDLGAYDAAELPTVAGLRDFHATMLAWRRESAPVVAS